MATKAQIRNKAARKLGKLALGQTLNNAISSDLDEAYDEVYASLRNEDLVNWHSTAEVPDELVSPVVDLVAFARANDYGVSDSRYQRLAIAVGSAEVRIRRFLKDDYFKDTNEAQYY